MSHLQQLFDKYVNNQCSSEEVETLMKYFHTDRQDELNTLILHELEELEIDIDSDSDSNDEAYKAILDKVYVDIKNEIHRSKKGVRSIWPRIAAAASILLILSVSGYFFMRKSVAPQQIAKTDISAGGNKVFLTLANGEKISLNDAKRGEVAKQFGVIVTKASNGQLAYNASHSTLPAAQPIYNTIETATGGQYQVDLPDGTKVWLNAASSLKYPVQFTGTERRVELTGEGYFEVAKDKTKPFRVITAKQQIEVLGTHFNANAYSDESSVYTTLLEGSVKLTANGGSSVILKPGQESTLSNDNITVQNADIESVLAWKNGYFDFNEDLESIMKKLARWYDIEVIYHTDKERQMRYGGKISRSKSISSVLKVIEATGYVHFKMEGRRVTVMN